MQTQAESKDLTPYDFSRNEVFDTFAPESYSMPMRFPRTQVMLRALHRELMRRHAPVHRSTFQWGYHAK